MGLFKPLMGIFQTLIFNNVDCNEEGVAVKEARANTRKCSTDATAVVDTIIVRGLEKVKPELFEMCVDGLREVNGFDNIVHEAHLAKNRLKQTRCFESVQVTVENSVGLNATPNGYRLCFDIEEAKPVSCQKASDNQSVLLYPNVGETSLGVQLTCVNIENGCFLTGELLFDKNANSTNSLTAHLPISRNWLGFLSFYNKTWRLPCPTKCMGTAAGLRWSPLRNFQQLLQLDVYRQAGNCEEWQVDLTNRISYDKTGVRCHTKNLPAPGLTMRLINKFGFLTTDDAFISSKFLGQHTVPLGKDAAVRFRVVGGLAMPRLVSSYSINDRINMLASVASNCLNSVNLTDKLLDVAPTSTVGLMTMSCHAFTKIPFVRESKLAYQLPRLHTFAGLATIRQSGHSPSVISSCGIGLTYQLYNGLHFEVDCFSNFTNKRTSTGYSCGLTFL